MAFLPLGRAARGSRGLLARPALDSVFAKAREVHQDILIHCPPVLEDATTLALLPQVDLVLLVVVEGKPASIESVRVLRVRFPDRAAVVSGSDDVNVGGDRAVEAIPVGVRLQVEPAMQGLTDIVLRIRAESSNLGQPLPPDNIPEEFRRVVDAEVVVADGETAVLGGLLQVTRGRAGAGLPYLRRVPLVGLLFGRRRVEREDQELLVLVTPRLLSPAAVGGGSR